MKLYRLILLLTLFCVSSIISQEYYYGTNISLHKLNSHVYTSYDNGHSIVKPYNHNNIPKQQQSLYNSMGDNTRSNKDIDTLFQTGLWNGIELNNKTKCIPILEYSNNFSDENTSNIGLGFQIDNLSYKRFKFQGRYIYKKGEVSDYSLSTLKRPYVRGLGLSSDTAFKLYNIHDVNLNLAFRANRYILLSIGNGKNFWGDGYRSLFLSDNSSPYPYFKIESEFWKVKYINLYSMHNDYSFYNGKLARKFSSSHLLSWNIHKNINLSVFESVVWQAKDTLNNRNFDVNYLNPIIFLRPVEYSIGSSDNSFLGANLKFKIFKNHILYSQVVFDEFLLSEFRENRGWWANKYGIQLGYKAYNPFKVNGLGYQFEFNTVRPYTYSHVSSLQNYGHNNQSIAHPLESNFIELLSRIYYQKNNITLLFQHTYQVYGKDYMNNNYGGNMYSSYLNYFSEYNNVTTQGEENIANYYSLQLSYMLIPSSVTSFFARFDYRDVYSVNNTLQQSIFSLGIKSNIWENYLDY